MIRRAKAGDPYALGALPSPHDDRDLVFSTAGAAGAPPSVTHPSVGKIPVRNQQGSTCVGNSIALAMQYLEHAETGQLIPIDGELINGRVVGRQFGEGAPMVPRDGLDDVLNHGAAAFMGQGGTALFFPKAYARVDHLNPDAVKAAITAPSTMLSAAIWLTSNFGGPSFTGKDYIHDTPGEKSWGYHEVTWVGYTDQGVIIQNSWGDDWGDHGLARLAWDWVAARVGELWAITDNLDNVGGRVNEWYAPTEPNAGRAVRKGKSQAVYRITTGGREWVQSPALAKQWGINLTTGVQSLPPTDKVWNLPVIGPDAPVQYQ